VRKNKKSIILENITVTDYAAEGKSIARVDGKVIFIERAIPGDIVNIQLAKNKKDWAEAHIVQLVQASNNRIEPFCSHFGTCGGCQWQMLPYDLQLQYKQKQVAEQLSRIGKVALPPIAPIMGAQTTKAYRNKIEYTFANKRYLSYQELHTHVSSTDKAGYAGYHARGVFDKVVAINTCYLQPEPTNLVRKVVENFCLEQNWEFYDVRQHTGWIRNMMIRMATTGEWMVNIIIHYEAKPRQQALLNRLLEQFPNITSVLFTINPKWNDSIYDLQPQCWHGKGYIIEELENFRFKISPKSFFQTNTHQGEALYEITRQFAELTGTETVYDLYCGTGSIGIFVSKQAAKIIGVEVVEDAIIDAKENAALNNLSHTQFFAGDVIEVCNDAFFVAHGRPQVIITDPPRAGMHEKLSRKLLEIAAPIIVYVSCNPATQARDLAILDEKYQVTAIQPVDMFPHTHHIENVVQLKLKP
jgi:23S rRNA (uracil1939-C5)-methyltransferase